MQNTYQQFSYLTFETAFETIRKLKDMAEKEKKQRLLKAKIAVALQDEYKRVPTKEEIEQVFHLTRVMYKAVLGLHYRRQEQKKSGQLTIF
jgi:hypothetical protein